VLAERLPRLDRLNAGHYGFQHCQALYLSVRLLQHGGFAADVLAGGLPDGDNAGQVANLLANLGDLFRVVAAGDDFFSASSASPASSSDPNTACSSGSAFMRLAEHFPSTRCDEWQ
jgi:hypothetical protein